MAVNAQTKLLYDYSAAAYWYLERHCHDDHDAAQLTQREITAWSFAVIRGARPDIQTFTGLLVQYPGIDRDEDAPGQIVPDNLVVIHDEPVETQGSFPVPLQPAAPFLVLEYVPEDSDQQDLGENFEQYERELKVPCYLRFHPDDQELALYRLSGEKYVAATPNEAGRLAIPELELEAALLDGWVRYWFRGELLPLPGTLLRERNAERAARLAAEAEIAELRAELARAKGA